MSDAFSVQLVGLQLFAKVLERVGDDLQDWRPFWEQVAIPFFHRWELEDFVVEGGRSGASWQSLSDPYAAWKRRHFPGAGILVRTGALKASLADAGASDAITRSQPTQLEVGTTVPYAKYLQGGTSRMPARPPLRVNEDFARAMGQAMRTYVQETWRRRRADVVGTAA